MRAHAELVVSAPRDRAAARFRVERMAGHAPVSWRPAGDAVYMVATSASPVGDDDVRLEVTARAGSELAVRSAGATVVWSGASTRHEVRGRVEPDASLDWAPEPLVATAGCNHSQVARVEVDPAGRLRWREILVLGRHGERPGTLRSVLSVDVGGRPLLRHELVVGAEGWSTGPAVLGPARVVGLLLVAGASTSAGVGVASAAPAGPTWAVTPLEGPGVLAVALGAGVPDVVRDLAKAEAVMAVGPARPPFSVEP